MSLDLAETTEMAIFFILATIAIGGALGLIYAHDYNKRLVVMVRFYCRSTKSSYY